MSHLSAAEVARLDLVAHEMYETGEESGYTVDVAVGQHRSFRRTGHAASYLERNLLLDAIEQTAAQHGIHPQPAQNALDLISQDGDTIRKYRVKRATRDADGQPVVYCSVGSNLLVTEPEEGLLRQEKWILGYITDKHHTVTEVFVGEIVDWSDAGKGPVRLKLRNVVVLSGATPPPGFVSTEEGLDGFDSGSEAGEG